jgi:hypothetical protein
MTRVLTTDNTPFNLDHVPEYVDDVRFCVLDCSDNKFIDFFFLPLIYLESFYSPMVELSIGEYTVKMPLDWSIMACDEDYGAMEVIPLTSLNDRGFHALLFNPLKHFVPESKEVTIRNVYSDVKWYFPKLRVGNILVVPVEDKEVPLCVMFVKDHAKIPAPLDIGTVFE